MQSRQKEEGQREEEEEEGEYEKEQEQVEKEEGGQERRCSRHSRPGPQMFQPDLHMCLFFCLSRVERVWRRVKGQRCPGQH